jgi:orotate phosphoribosyltransferase
VSLETTSEPTSVLDLFRQTGAYLTGHFRLSSGLHSPEYLQCALVLQHPRHAETLGRALAEKLRPLAGGPIDAVISPAMGGLMIGHEVARALGVRHIFAERDAERKMTLRRGFTVRPGERFVLIEDVITTGLSSREVVELLTGLGAVVVAAGSIVDRSAGQADLGCPRAALETLNVQSYAAEACPLCRQGLPVVKPGSRPV